MSYAPLNERDDALELGRFLCRPKKKKKGWKVAPLCLFYPSGGESNRRAFENCESLHQTIKNSFLYLFWEWVRLYIGDGSMSLLDFVNWLGSS